MNPIIGRWCSKKRDKHLFRNQGNKVGILATSFLKGCTWALPALCTPSTAEYLGACAIRYKGLDTSKGSRWGEWGDQSSFSRAHGGPTNCRHLFITSAKSGSALKKNSDLKKNNYFSVKTNWYVSGIAKVLFILCKTQAWILLNGMLLSTFERWLGLQKFHLSTTFHTALR